MALVAAVARSVIDIRIVNKGCVPLVPVYELREVGAVVVDDKVKVTATLVAWITHQSCPPSPAARTTSSGRIGRLVSHPPTAG